MSESITICGKCNVNIPANLRVIKCNSCQKYYHVKCCDINHKIYNSMVQDNKVWHCQVCASTKVTRLNTHSKLSGKSRSKCGKCCKYFASNSNPLNCNICNLPFHVKCVNASSSLARNLRNGASWSCYKCVSESLPFHSLDKENTFLAIHGPRGANLDLINKPSFTIQSLLDQMPGQNFSSDEFLNDSISSKYYSAGDFLETKFSNNFTMLHLNIASLSKHIDELRNLLFLLDFPFDVIGITETRLHDDDPIVNLDIKGYDFIHTPTSTNCGGAGIYIKSSYDYAIKKDLFHSISNLTETIFIEIKRNKNKNLLVGCVYRHHCPVSGFLTRFFSPMLDNINRYSNKTCAIMGDFNINLINYASHTPTSDFYDLFSSYGFRPLILQPTRVTSTTATLIDNIFINDMTCNSYGGNLTSSISDHFLQFSQIDLFNSEKVTPFVKYSRNFRDFDKRKFSNELSKIDWSSIVTNNLGTNNSYQLFYDKIINLLDEMAPYRKLTKKEIRLDQRPWITKGILVSMRKRDDLFKRMAREKNPTLKLEIDFSYKKYRNMLTILLKQNKKNNFSVYILDNYNNTKKTWDGIRELVNVSKKKNNLPNKIYYNDKEINSPLDIADSFNDFFSNIGKNVEEKIPKLTTSYSAYMNNPNDKSIFLSACDNDEILATINGLKSSTASGPNSFPSFLLSEFAPLLVQPLCAIINMSLQEGVFPSLLKAANICPIFKKGEKFKCENYRPISLLSNISKIFEKIMYNRVENFLISSNQFYDLQFGFRRKHSTNHALLSIVETIREAMDNKLFSCGVFIDLEKAFDTVNHKILLSKLSYYGIRGNANTWFESYLTGRTQSVCINGKLSTKCSITCGVPQGSILGPLLFLLYINDMHLSIRNSTIYHFADDTNLLLSSKSLKDLRKMMNQDLKLVFEWLCANRLSLNADKTEFLIFRPPKRDSQRITLSLNRQTIFESTKIRYLGLILDNKLNWKFHVSELSKKLSRSIGIICKIKPFCSTHVLKSLYYSLFNSHLSYGLSTWGGNVSIALLQKLQVLQNRVLRIITSVSPDNPVHCADIRKSLGILTIDDQIKVQLSSIMWDYDQKSLPTHLGNLFLRSSDIHDYKTRGASRGNLFYKKVNTSSYGIKSLKVQGVKLFNELLQNDVYNQAKTKKSFLKNYKLELLSQY